MPFCERRFHLQWWLQISEHGAQMALLLHFYFCIYLGNQWDCGFIFSLLYTDILHALLELEQIWQRQPSRPVWLLLQIKAQWWRLQVCMRGYIARVLNRARGLRSFKICIPKQQGKTGYSGDWSLICTLSLSTRSVYLYYTFKE